MSDRINIIDGSTISGVRLDKGAIDAEIKLEKYFGHMGNSLNKIIPILNKTIKPTTVATVEDLEALNNGEEIETITAFASNITDKCSAEEQAFIDNVIAKTKEFKELIDSIPAEMFSITDRL